MIACDGMMGTSFAKKKTVSQNKLKTENKHKLIFNTNSLTSAESGPGRRPPRTRVTKTSGPPNCNHKSIKPPRRRPALPTKPLTRLEARSIFFSPKHSPLPYITQARYIWRRRRPTGPTAPRTGRRPGGWPPCTARCRRAGSCTRCPSPPSFAPTSRSPTGPPAPPRAAPVSEPAFVVPSPPPPCASLSMARA
jgi:hypothetical protein